MKPLAAILLCILLASCAGVFSPVPKPRIVQTAELQEAAGRLKESSAKVRDGIVHVTRAAGDVDRSSDRISDKTKQLLIAMEDVRARALAMAGANAEIQAAFDRQTRAFDDVLVENDSMKIYIKELLIQIDLMAAAKEEHDGDVVAVVGEVKDVSEEAMKSGEEIDTQTKAYTGALASVAGHEKTKGKLTWWRWYGVALSAAIIGYIAFRIWGVAIKLYLSTQYSALRGRLPL
jgi:hypothetical protein